MSGAIREPQESAHMEEKHTPATHLMVGEDSPSQEHWEFGTETKKVSNGEVVRVRTGRLTPAPFYKAVETLTVSMCPLEPRIGLRRERKIPNMVLRPMKNEA